MSPTAPEPISSRLGSIELCRGIAAVMVVLFHSNIILGQPKNFGLPPLQNLSYFGRSGVDFFFILSGFLITLLHWRDIGQPKAFRRYALRRLTRVYPTYWLVLIAVVPGDLLLHTLFDHYNSPVEVLKAVFLLPQTETILNVTWSLNHELLFYILFGAAIFRRTLGIVLAALWLIGLTAIWATGASSHNMTIQTFILPLNFEFFAGVAAGWTFGHFPIKHAGALLIFGLGLFAALWFGDDFLWPLRLGANALTLRCLGYSAAAAAVILGLCTLEIRGHFTVPKSFVILGGSSYLLYLIHVPILLVLATATRSIDRHRFGPDWVLALAFDVVVIACAVLGYLKIERPILRAIQRRKPRTLAVAAH